MWRVDDCFIHGCVFYCWMWFFLPFFSHCFWPCHYGFSAFPCLWEISFCNQMISGTVSWSSSDHVIVLPVRCGS